MHIEMASESSASSSSSSSRSSSSVSEANEHHLIDDESVGDRIAEEDLQSDDELLHNDATIILEHKHPLPASPPTSVDPIESTSSVTVEAVPIVSVSVVPLIQTREQLLNEYRGKVSADILSLIESLPIEQSVAPPSVVPLMPPVSVVTPMVPKARTGVAKASSKSYKSTFLHILDATQETVISAAAPSTFNSYANNSGLIQLTQDRPVEDGLDLTQPRVFGAAWNSARSTLNGFALHKFNKDLEEATHLHFRTKQGQTIKVAKLMDLRELDTWLGLLAHNSGLLMKIATIEEVERMLHPHVAISEAAKMALSAQYTNSRDINKMSAEEIMTLLKRINEVEMGKRKPQLSQILTILREKVQPIRKWQYEKFSTHPTCEQWVSNVWTIVYTVLQKATYQAVEREVTQLFLGCLEPAGFRQHLVLALYRKINSSDNKIPTFTGVVELDWNSTFSIIAFVKLEANKVDNISEDVPSFFETLGTSNEHKAQFRLLPADVKSFAQSVLYDRPQYAGSKPTSHDKHNKEKKIVNKRRERDDDDNTTNTSGSKKGRWEKKPTGTTNVKSVDRAPQQTPVSSNTISATTASTRPCLVCNVVGHSTRKCPGGKCFPGCNVVPSTTHNPFHCKYNPYNIAKKQEDKKVVHSKEPHPKKK